MINKAYFAGGCFWCVEAVLKNLNGVEKVTSGYAGGSIDNPNYEQVSSGTTGHVETVEVLFDPSIISYELLLDVFFTSHDPTTVNRQGSDVGEQYRSVIFYINEDQKRISEEFINKLEKEKVYNNTIITSVTKLIKFYPAEEYHQNYYDNNKSAPYCQIVINPKLSKIRQKFSGYLK
ncbi:MAG TPA: peptide-methionine (S)-S-oxide reductase MsrA [Patescibacteria group bacterium]|nr:peptide-methionine (S)-S-oxide reductase MsrA [Patescibacteria group bacterium]